MRGLSFSGSVNLISVVDAQRRSDDIDHKLNRIHGTLHHVECQILIYFQSWLNCLTCFLAASRRSMLAFHGRKEKSERAASAEVNVLQGFGRCDIHRRSSRRHLPRTVPCLRSWKIEGKDTVEHVMKTNFHQN